MIGDRPDTDGLFAQRLGCRYAQVWSGVTAKGSAVQPTPWISGDTMASLVDDILADQA
jgi:ribonucleotide monophosphatase NagD (HAD superfamily)